MKKAVILSALLFAVIHLSAISPYLLLGNLDENLDMVEIQIKEHLSENGFQVIGTYSPMNKSGHRVIVFTSSELKAMCEKSQDLGLLAGALKVAIRMHKEKAQVTMLNPEYLFYAYLRTKMDDPGYEKAMLDISEKAIKALRYSGAAPQPFGGEVSKKDLKKYKYMMGMPKFDDAVILNEFESQQEALQVIRKNLSAKKGNTKKVFELSNPDGSSVVFGVGLLDPEKGEGHFLPIIGKKHIAAMPYELIVEDGVVSMLHGRFRFASHWPELTMGTFTKIMSSPGDVEDFMEAITE